MGDRIERVPWRTAVPIYIDSAVDGLLVGIVAVASIQGGAVMAAATGIEMMFLGLTFGAMVRRCGGKRWAIAIVAPLCLIIAGVIGALAADALKQTEWAFQGVVAFGVSALLYLVVEELLKEAQENIGDEDDWMVSPTIWFFCGFILVVLVGRIFPEADGLM